MIIDAGTASVSPAIELIDILIKDNLWYIQNTDSIMYGSIRFFIFLYMATDFEFRLLLSFKYDQNKMAKCTICNTITTHESLK